MRVLSWNVAFGSPFHTRRGRDAVRQHLDDVNADVLLLQEAVPEVLSPRWTAVAPEARGFRGSSVLIAVPAGRGIARAELEVDSLPSEGHCFVAADLVVNGQSLRAMSLYVPWRSSSSRWLRHIMRTHTPGPSLLGADANSPVGSRPAPHSMFRVAEQAGWAHLSAPLLSLGPTHKKSQIDHVWGLGLRTHSWHIDRSVLDRGLSDHAALVLEVQPAAPKSAQHTSPAQAGVQLEAST